MTDQSVIESILHPSKLIAKEYQSSTVLDLDGKIQSGIIVTQDDKRIVLRDMQDVTKLITINRTDIEQIAQSPNSLMPSDLANQLKDRQQFLDLLRYVLDLKERGTDAEVANTTKVVRRELSSELSGLVAMRKYNCGRCHSDLSNWTNDAPSNAPDLKWSARHVDAGYLARFIADPQHTKPGTTMPQMMAGMDSAKRNSAANAIVAYLISLSPKAASATPKTPAATETTVASVTQGHATFHEVGCAACHSPRDSDGAETLPESSVPLGTLDQKYSRTSLTVFLEDPHAARPHGLMPNMQLTHREAVDVSAFLLQDQNNLQNPANESSTDDTALIRQGQELFRSLNCVRCHTSIDTGPTANAAAAPTELNSEAGCLAEQPQGDSPQFDLSATEVSNLRSAIAAEQTSLSNQQQIDLNLTYFNCTACHSRDDLGGVPADRRVHFQTTNLNLGEQGRIPPPLSGVGAKLKRKWMRDVLVLGRSVRPYMKTRMPKFREANVGHLIDLLQSTDQLPPTEFAKFDDLKAVRNQGLELAGNKGLNCVACHTYQFKISDTMPAVDLTEMSERLEKDWFYQYMLAPQRFAPGTVMPSFWPNGKAIRPDLKGTPQDHVEALWQYLLDGRQARAPRGVIRKPLEIVVTDEARMLRRSYQGMGKRGIGVGYPGGINLAFDAEQMRLATLWKGGFVDPSGVWYGQGHGKVRSLGPAMILAVGPEIDDANNPWVADDGRPPNHKFRGYKLDEKRRPTFRYSVGNVSIEDYFVESRIGTNAAQSLTRELTLTTTGDSAKLRFRLLEGSDVRIDATGKRISDDRLTIRILSDHVARSTTIKNADPASDQTNSVQAKPTQAYVPVDLEAGTIKLKFEYFWK